MKKFIPLILVLFFNGCALQEKNSMGNVGSEPTTTPSFQKSLLNQSNAVYKIENQNITEFLIEMVKFDILTRPKTLYIGEIMLSLVPIGREAHFNCKRFYDAIGENRINIVKEKMRTYLFKCRDGTYTEEAALEKLSKAINPTIEEFFEVDATWAWFSATGNNKALERLITNYLRNDKACRPCIEWSYSTNSIQNRDVYSYLSNYSQSASNEDKLKLFRLGPKTEGN